MSAASPSPYCNNLRLGDPIYVASLKRFGIVDTNCRESSLGATVLLVGSNTPRYFHISDLRFVADGVPEDVPPCEGPVPVPAAKIPRLNLPAPAESFAINPAMQALVENLVDRHFRKTVEQFYQDWDKGMKNFRAKYGLPEKP